MMDSVTSDIGTDNYLKFKNVYPFLLNIERKKFLLGSKQTK